MSDYVRTVYLTLVLISHWACLPVRLRDVLQLRLYRYMWNKQESCRLSIMNDISAKIPLSAENHDSLG